MKTTPVTNHLLWKAYQTKNDDNLTPLRVQKLLYFLHGWYMAITGEPLLDEPFIRGKYGPYLASLEQPLKRFGNSPVDDYLVDDMHFSGSTQKPQPMFVNLAVKTQFKDILDKVWDTYAPFETGQLSSLSHTDHGPWGSTLPGQAISNDLIKEYFVQQSKPRPGPTP